MTVMVTGASGPLGHALIPRLVARDEVRAAVRRPETAGALRAMGAKVTVGRLDDTDALANEATDLLLRDGANSCT